MRPQGIFEGYRGGEMPLGGYAALMGAYLALFGGIGASLARSGRLPRLSRADVALVGVATHKLTRLVTRDWVTIPLRAPFTELVGSAGGGEVDEKARGTGVRRAIGDLLTCSYCTGPWVASALLAGIAKAPRATRTIAAMLAAVAVSDFLHEAYESLRTFRTRESAERDALARRSDGEAREGAAAS